MSIDLRALLLALGQGDGVPATSALLRLSDLTRDQAKVFRKVWPHLPDARRRLLVQLLRELAEASFEAHFNVVFRACLADSDPDVRREAIRGLWEDQDVALVGQLLQMLQADPAVEVRAAAAQALGRFVLRGELDELDARIAHRIREELLRVIHTPQESLEVRRRAVESVSFSPQPEVQAMLEAAYYEEEEVMRLSAVCGMGRSLDRTWEPILIAELRSASPAMRYEAVIACGELGSRRALSSVIQLADDPDPQVLEATLWSLGRIGGDAARDVLLAAYEGADPHLQDVIEDALSELEFAADELDFPLVDLAPGMLQSEEPEPEGEWDLVADLDDDLEELAIDDWDEEWAARSVEEDDDDWAPTDSS
jgi:hypothetical protein